MPSNKSIRVPQEVKRLTQNSKLLAEKQNSKYLEIQKVAKHSNRLCLY
jgi:hypothetical protein